MSDGKTLAWSQKHYSKEYATWQLPCSKCLECRLEYARHWAIRCVHEARMYDENCFITLTYDDDHVGDGRLNYKDFQLFMKKLRKTKNEPIGMFVTGEYGDGTKRPWYMPVPKITRRPHWHAIIFNWRPRDGTPKYTNATGDQVYDSKLLTKLWGNGTADFGSVTFKSAGYVARYAAKKLIHGDEVDKYQPISKKSSKNAIGKKWLEKYYPDVFNYGNLELPGGIMSSIPRYYEKWFKENHPEKWRHYVTNVKTTKTLTATLRSDSINKEYFQNVWRRGPFRKLMLTPNQVRSLITQSKFKTLQDKLKL